MGALVPLAHLLCEWWWAHMMALMSQLVPQRMGREGEAGAPQTVVVAAELHEPVMRSREEVEGAPHLQPSGDFEGWKE